MDRDTASSTLRREALLLSLAQSVFWIGILGMIAELITITTRDMPDALWLLPVVAGLAGMYWLRRGD